MYTLPETTRRKFWIKPVRLARNLGFSARELVEIERIVHDNEKRIVEAWMNTSALKAGERIVDVTVAEHTLSVDLADGRTITVPLAWFPKLLNATAEQRSSWRIASGGYGVHWHEIDEDLSVEGFLHGAPAPAHGTRGAA
jgi:hypothetical protein